MSIAFCGILMWLIANCFRDLCLNSAPQKAWSCSSQPYSSCLCLINRLLNYVQSFAGQYQSTSSSDLFRSLYPTLATHSLPILSALSSSIASPWRVVWGHEIKSFQLWRGNKFATHLMVLHLNSLSNLHDDDGDDDGLERNEAISLADNYMVVSRSN